MTTTEAKWRAIIGEQERSGMTVREFAARRGLASGTLFWWRSRLRRKRRPADAALVPVEVLDSAADGSRSIELLIREDVLLRLPHDFHEADLRRVLGVLGKPC
jgi:transposase-like protein